MEKRAIVSIDEEFEKARVKGFTRVRRGRMERVNPFERKDWGGITVTKVEPLKGHEGKGIITNFPPLKLEEIKSVYVGVPDKCMCGCSGKYYYSKANQKRSSKERGYEVTNDEVSDAKINRVLNKIKKHESSGIEVLRGLHGEYIFTTVIGRTQYTVYALGNGEKNKSIQDIQDEVIEKATQVSGYTRTRRGRTERVKGYPVATRRAKVDYHLDKFNEHKALSEMHKKAGNQDKAEEHKMWADLHHKFAEAFESPSSHVALKKLMGYYQ